MTMQTRAIATMIVVFMAAPASAEIATAGAWRADCANYINILAGATDGDDLAVTYCIGQTVGIISALMTGSQIGAVSMASTLTVAFELDSDEVFRVFRSKDAASLLGVCFPDGSRTGEHVQIVYRYLEEHPDKAPMPAPAVFFEALSAAYPCPSTQPEE